MALFICQHRSHSIRSLFLLDFCRQVGWHKLLASSNCLFCPCATCGNQKQAELPHLLRPGCLHLAPLAASPAFLNPPQLLRNQAHRTNAPPALYIIRHLTFSGMASLCSPTSREYREPFDSTIGCSGRVAFTAFKKDHP